MTSKIDFLDKVQLVVRKRHPSVPPMEYDDCYDEYIGMKPTGRIIRGYKEVVFDANLVQKQEEPKEIIIKEKQFKLIVNTIYGEYLVDVYDENSKKNISLNLYSQELVSKFKDVYLDVKFVEI